MSDSCKDTTAADNTRLKRSHTTREDNLAEVVQSWFLLMAREKLDQAAD